jgi:hypothetical protein
MAGHPNEALLRTGYDAFSQGDMDALSGLFADDIVWHEGGRGPLAGEYKGKEAVFGFFGKLMEVTGDTAKVELHDVLANDEHGVALLTNSFIVNGRSWSGSDVHVFHIKDGKMTEFWDSPVDRYGADEALTG